MPHRPARLLAVLLTAIALLASACVAAGPASERRERPGQPGSAPVSSRSDPAPARKPRPTRAAGATVRVVMNDRFRYRPDAIMVREGRMVTFAVTNVGRLPHEFVLGDRATQLDHERQMQGSMTGGQVHIHGGHAAHGSGGLTVPPGETRQMTRTFDEPGIILYGCHVLGHWAAGMRGTIVVVASDRPLPLPSVSPPGPRAAPGP
jgi:uncharacterized cupredoxin-like copper-binding protein